MFFKELFVKKLSVRQGMKILAVYCRVNGFENYLTHWKKVTYSTKWFSYSKRSTTKRANNWVAFHPVKKNEQYSIWIDLVTGEIREVLK